MVNLKSLNDIFTKGAVNISRNTEYRGKGPPDCMPIHIKKNIAKGTTDPRVEFISQDHSSQFKNLEHISISEYQLSIKIKISTRHKHLD